MNDTMDSLIKEIDSEMEHNVHSIENEEEQSYTIPLNEVGDETMEMIVDYNTKRNIQIKRNIDLNHLNSQEEQIEQKTNSRISSMEHPIMVKSDIPILSPKKENYIEEPVFSAATTVSASSAYEGYPSDITSPNEDEQYHENNDIRTISYSSNKDIRSISFNTPTPNLNLQNSSPQSTINNNNQMMIIPSVNHNTAEEFESCQEPLTTSDSIDVSLLHDSDPEITYHHDETIASELNLSGNTLDKKDSNSDSMSLENVSNVLQPTSTIETKFSTPTSPNNKPLQDDKITNNLDTELIESNLDNSINNNNTSKLSNNSFMNNSNVNDSSEMADNSDNCESMDERERSNVSSKMTKIIPSNLSEPIKEESSPIPEKKNIDEIQNSDHIDDLIDTVSEISDDFVIQSNDFEQEDISLVSVHTVAESSSRLILNEILSDKNNNDQHVDNRQLKESRIDVATQTDESLIVTDAKEDAPHFTNKTYNDYVMNRSDSESSDEEFYDTSSQLVKPISEAASPNLSALPKFNTLFIDNQFGDEEEIAREISESSKTAKPSGYLSIWHKQKDSINIPPPSITDNVNINIQRMLSTGSSASSSSSHSNFKFKPRLVSRSKIYNPRKSSEFSYTSSINAFSRNTSATVNDKSNNSKKPTQVIKVSDSPKKLENNPPSIWKVAEKNNKLEGKNLVLADLPTESERDETNRSISLADLSVRRSSLFGSYNDMPGGRPVAIKNNSDVPKISKDSNDFNRLPSISLNDSSEGFSMILDQLPEHSDLGSENEEKPKNKTDYGLWHQKSISSLNAEKTKVTDDVLEDLLSVNDQNSDDIILMSDVKPPTMNPANIVEGYIKTPVKNVSIGRGININGFSAIESDDEYEEYNEVIDAIKEVEIEPPVKVQHVGSPFKVLNRSTSPTLEPNEPVDETPIIEIEHSSEKETKIESDVEINEPEVVEVVKPALKDKGYIYLDLKDINKFDLENIAERNAEFSIEIDNGEYVVETNWQQLNSEGKLELNRNLEIILAPNVKKLTITLKCRYDKQTHQMVEVVNKVPVEKQTPYGKKQFRYQKTMQKKEVHDEWRYLFAEDGTFARCELEFNESFLDQVKYMPMEFHMDLFNQWARTAPPANCSSGINIYDLPRKPAYKVAELKLSGCFLERTSDAETFPSSFKIVNAIVNKYRHQHNISKEGYLFQEGGDVDGNPKRRWFKLQGTSLIGYHDLTREVSVVINLLKVKDVVSSDDAVIGEGRNFTNSVLYGDSIQLVFQDNESIILNTEIRQPKNKNDWYDKLKEVVTLNVCHQPWVRTYSDISRLTQI